jgi:hypothetical protein
LSGAIHVQSPGKTIRPRQSRLARESIPLACFGAIASHAAKELDPASVDDFAVSSNPFLTMNGPRSSPPASEAEQRVQKDARNQHTGENPGRAPRGPVRHSNGRNSLWSDQDRGEARMRRFREASAQELNGAPRG